MAKKKKNNNKLNVKYIQSDINIPLKKEISSSQNMLRELIGGSNKGIWGSGEGLPKINNREGISRNDNGETSRMFGFIK